MIDEEKASAEVNKSSSSLPVEVQAGLTGQNEKKAKTEKECRQIVITRSLS